MAGDARLLSRRLERWAPWVAGAVLVAGIISFTLTRPVHHEPIAHARAVAIAREFVATAVTRKDLARGWDLAGPELKQGQSRAEWLRGTIAVQPYHGDVSHATYSVEGAGSDEASVGVTFPPRGPQFELGLRRHGNEWLVSRWSPRGAIHP